MPQPGYNFNIIPMGIAKKQAIAPTTERLLIIGPAVDGPVNTPISCNDGNTALSVFGPTVYTNEYFDPNTAAAGSAALKLWNGNYLVRAFLEAQAAGSADVYLVRTGGTYATGAHGSLTGYSFRSKFPGYIYNTQTVSAICYPANSASSTSITFFINQPAGKGGNISKSFLSSDTIATVIEWFGAPQVLTGNGTFELDCSVLSNLTNSATTLGATGVGLGWVLAGGTNGTNVPGEQGIYDKSYLYTELTKEYGTFDMLKDFNFDVAVLTGIYLDDVVVANNYTTSTASAFAKFIQDVSDRTRPCFGVIGCRPITESRLDRLTRFVTDNYLSTTSGPVIINGTADSSGAQWLRAGGVMVNGFIRTNDDGTTTDMGSRIAVFAGPDFVRNNADTGYYHDNGAVIYAAFLSTLSPARAATLQPIPGVFALGTNFPRDMVDDLVTGITVDALTKNYGPAYVVAKNDPDLGGMVFADDPTAGWRNSEFSQQQPVHVVNIAARRIREVTQPFIGHSNDDATRAAISTGIRNKLEQLYGMGALQGSEGIGYSFVVSADPTDNILGVVNIVLSLRPAYAIRTINVTIMVRQ